MGFHRADRFLLYNYLSRKKEVFTPLSSTVGMYVCGPTVYGAPHLGHARCAVVFDTLYRALLFRSWKVRYVRNVTDVGHLEGEELDIGDDKIGKAARIEQLEPMEIAQKYLNSYHDIYAKLGTLAPSIEPQASGHIPEQIDMARRIVEKGYGYESQGSVYFDLQKFDKEVGYGRLSKKVISELLKTSRSVEGTEDKKFPLDFALWKKADAQHLMQWDSPWSRGFPGWHLECTAMGAKYLGDEFDIHGGGLDLQFPHHEAEITQSLVLHEKLPARYWIYNNMLTVEKKKMSKSLGNFVTVHDLFEGRHEHFGKALDPMVLRFYFLRTHYRSIMDFSADALHASSEGLQRLSRMRDLAENLQREDAVGKKGEKICELADSALACIFDDLDTPALLAHLFRLGATLAESGSDRQSYAYAARVFATLYDDVLGLSIQSGKGQRDLTQSLLDLFLAMRKEARAKKDFVTSDRIRDELRALGIEIEDTKEGEQVLRYQL